MGIRETTDSDCRFFSIRCRSYSLHCFSLGQVMEAGASAIEPLSFCRTLSYAIGMVAGGLKNTPKIK